MINHTDDIEQFSRAAAENYDAGMEPQWELFLPKLNEAMPQSNKRRRGIFWWLIVCTLTMVGAWSAYHYFYKSGTQMDSTKVLRPAHIPHATTIPKTPQLDEKKHQPKSLSTYKMEDTVVLHQSMESSKSTRVAFSPYIGVAMPKRSVGVAKRSAPLANSVSVGAASVYNSANTTKNVRIVSDSMAQKGINIQLPVNEVAAAIDTQFTALNSQQSNSQRADSLRFASQDTQSFVIPDTLLLPKINHKRTWSVELLGAADISTVKLTYLQNISYGYGAFVGYHFNKRWSIHTGMVYTQKNYKAAGTDFNVPKSSWLANYTITKVAGTCSMWEMPMVGRFAFYVQPRLSYFASLGLSTYFMQRERYNYQYYYQQNLVNRTVNYNNKKNYWYSIVHVSAGVNKALLPHVWLQIEPYIKVPVKGVGYGSIALSSMGINAGIQWRKSRR